MAVANGFRMVEAWAVKRYGESMRASDEERAGIIDAGTYAAVIYAPLFLSHPLAPLGLALGGWIVRGTMDTNKANADASTEGNRPPGPGQPGAAAHVPTAKLDRSGARVEGFGEDPLDQG